MNRRLRFPLLFLSLLAMWLALNQSLAPGQILLGAALALGGTAAFASLQVPQARMRRPAAIAQLLWLVFADIVRSNIAVARIVLGSAARKRTAGFLSMPLELRHPGGLAVMACIVTATPGTSWAGYDAQRNILTIHVLDLIDEQAWIHTIKHRYERRLLEIFE
ncbi:MAG TPA: Na+/H+ antiporter subunit E [Burkholderiales bacterium]|nr:Na+/H+ antiporter subunit E [Burkholderiales bacterium]